MHVVSVALPEHAITRIRAGRQSCLLPVAVPKIPLLVLNSHVSMSRWNNAIETSCYEATLAVRHLICEQRSCLLC